MTQLSHFSLDAALMLYCKGYALDVGQNTL